MSDDALYKCNETELLTIARRQGLGALRRGLPKEELVAIVAGYKNPSSEHYAGTQFTRKKLEDFILANWGVVRSQLPGCNGKCTEYPCSEATHASCFAPNKESV